MGSGTAVDTALVAALQADATLLGLLPDGVWMDLAPANCRQFCRVVRESHDHEEGLGATLYERFVYQVDAVMLATDSAGVRMAADRIQELLYRVPLTVSGYVWMSTVLTAPIRFLDPDPLDSDTRWQHRGAFYEIHLSPT